MLIGIMVAGLIGVTFLLPARHNNPSTLEDDLKKNSENEERRLTGRPLTTNRDE